MALRIGEVGEPEIDAGDRRLRHDRLPTERFRPGEHGRRVIDLDIERGLAAAAFRAGVDPARQAAIAWFDQSAIGSGVWVAGADSPREHLAVELAQRLGVFTGDSEPENGIRHRFLLLGLDSVAPSPCMTRVAIRKGPVSEGLRPGHPTPEASRAHALRSWRRAECVQE